MLLQPTTPKPPLNLRNHGQNSLCLSSNFSYSLSFPSGFCNSTVLKPTRTQKDVVFTCRISQVHSYGSVDYERRRVVKWKVVYKRILNVEEGKGSGSVLNQWENEGRNLTKWELSRIIKELRKFKRFESALEVIQP